MKKINLLLPETGPRCIICVNQETGQTYAIPAGVARVREQLQVDRCLAPLETAREAPPEHTGVLKVRKL